MGAEFNYLSSLGITQLKLLDVSRLTALGWQASIALEDGLRDAYAWYVANQGSARLV